MQKLLGSMRRAISDYKMISDGDKIAVGVSGGKDSLCLLYALSLYRRFSPEKFDLIAVTVDLGIGDTKKQIAKISEFCESIGVPYFVEYSDIGDIIFNERKEKNPCSLCSKMRRGALNSVAKREGANKVALGHHANDLLETFLLSFTYEGRLSTFMPVSYLDKTGVTVIRPFIYADEGDISGATKRHELPVMKNPCPADHHTQREYMKNLVKTICKDIPFARDRMFSAITHPERYNLIGLPEADKGEES